MPILDWLRETGGRLGLVQFVSTSAPASPKKVPTRTVTLKELLAEARTGEACAAAPSNDLAQSFEDIYKEAGITPPEHGWTIQRLAEWLHAEVDLKAPRETIQLTILHKLTSEKAHVQDVVKDALARDHALDAHLVCIARLIEQRKADRDKQALQIDKEIRSLQTRLEQLREESRRESAGFDEWRNRKTAAEKEMAWALGFLVNEQVVSVDEK